VESAVLNLVEEVEEVTCDPWEYQMSLMIQHGYQWIVEVSSGAVTVHDSGSGGFWIVVTLSKRMASTLVGIGGRIATRGL
jgi:hypothetical protein